MSRADELRGMVRWLDGAISAAQPCTTVCDIDLKRIRDLLTRTEAAQVGDEADTFAEWLATEMPAGTVIGNPAWWANRIARQYRMRSGITNPQDASAVAKLDEVSAYVIKLAEECDDLYGRAVADRDDDMADYQVTRLIAINQIGRKLGCLVDAAMSAKGRT